MKRLPLDTVSEPSAPKAETSPSSAWTAFSGGVQKGEEYHAAGIYESVGFQRTECQVGIDRWEKEV